MTTVHLLQAFPDVRENYRRRFRHVLVDEYQDTNHAQYSLIQQLCGQSFEELETEVAGERVEPSELMVVGDADQSIYAFRGADIRNIMDFEQDFPDATTILLEQNYRSTQTILTAANSVIGNNRGRKAKRLWTDAGAGERIVGYVSDDEHDEARFVSQEIDTLVDERRRTPRRRRRVLPHQRPVPGLRGGVHPHRPALQGRRRGALLRAQGGPRRAGLPPDAGQHRRRDLAAPGAQHPQARHRRAGRGVHRRPRRPRPDHLLGGADPRRRGARPGHPQPEEHRGVRRDGAGAPVDGRGRRAPRRDPGVGARALRLPHRARGQRGPAGRHPRGEPRRARRGGPRVRRGPAARAQRRPGRGRGRHGRRSGSATSSSGSRWWPTPTRSPTPPTATTPASSR